MSLEREFEDGASTSMDAATAVVAAEGRRPVQVSVRSLDHRRMGSSPVGIGGGKAEEFRDGQRLTLSTGKHRHQQGQHQGKKAAAIRNQRTHHDQHAVLREFFRFHLITSRSRLGAVDTKTRKRTDFFPYLRIFLAKCFC